jgi:xanthine dehydrogenase YagS FAD-binding subunit
MQPFEYASPKALKEALPLLGATWDDAAVLAGGTDLLDLMKDGLMQPKRVVSVKDVAELKGITKTASGLRIGAAVTLDELMGNPLVRASFPSLVEAARGVSSQQIRNMGTVGGDLCQHTRCWYYRAGFGLIAQYDGKNLLVDGDNRYAAIFGDGPAHFVSASSFGPALVALGAKVKLVSADASREIEVEKFFVTPKTGDLREVALAANEILTEINIPTAGTLNATYEVRQKEALDWPLATASVALQMKGGTVAKARVVLGHVAPVPYVSEQAAAALEGKALNAQTAEAAGKAAVSNAKPLSGNAYKVQLAAVAVKRALLAAGAPKA